METKNRLLGNPCLDWIRIFTSLKERAQKIFAIQLLHNMIFAIQSSQEQSSQVIKGFLENLPRELSPLAEFFRNYLLEEGFRRQNSKIEELNAFYRLNFLKSSRLLNLFQKACENLNTSIYILTPFDDLYPKELLLLPNPPPFIYAAGKIESLQKGEIRSLAGIIGSRSPTPYGKKIARNIATYLVEKEHGIVSGLARGIDIISQRAAIKAGGYTIAVLGSGFINIYPSEHLEDCKEIVNSGLLITEYAPDIKAKPENFPERNRIIAGFSKFLIIVEAKEKSGVFTTVESANILGIDVWAVPGPIDSELSLGTNRLIAEGALTLVDLSMLDIYETEH